MNQDIFEKALTQTANNLSAKLQKRQSNVAPKEFEKLVLDELKTVCGNMATASTAFHQHAFPDIVVNGFGVEVKYTNKNSWRAVGNSIFEGKRDSSAKIIYVMYGKMGGWPEVRWSLYEDCVTHVRMSHAPRFVIEMEESDKLFDVMDISYKEFCDLSSEEKMDRVRTYARGRLGKGERLWWLEDRDEHTLPMAVTIYRHLEKELKTQYRAECALLFPEIVQGGGVRSKYDRAGLYLITQYGVYAPQLRDLYTAGSVGARGGKRGHLYIVDALRDIEDAMVVAAENLDARLFVEYWGKDVPVNKRIDTWLIKADKFASGWKPSERLFRKRK